MLLVFIYENPTSFTAKSFCLSQKKIDSARASAIGLKMKGWTGISPKTKLTNAFAQSRHHFLSSSMQLLEAALISDVVIWCFWWMITTFKAGELDLKLSSIVIFNSKICQSSYLRQRLWEGAKWALKRLAICVTQDCQSFENLFDRC